VTKARTIVVVGEGVEQATPDECLVHLAFNVMADTPANALTRVAALADRGMQVLQGHGVADRDLQTFNLSVQDFFDQKEGRVTARVGSYSFGIKVRPLDRIGELLAALAEEADDSLQVRGMQLMVSNPEVVTEVARRRAVGDAQSRARQLAESAGVRLGPILSISEDPSGIGIMGYRVAARTTAGQAFSMPVEPGTIPNTVHVTVTYAIEG